MKNRVSRFGTSSLTLLAVWLTLLPLTGYAEKNVEKLSIDGIILGMSREEVDENQLSKGRKPYSWSGCIAYSEFELSGHAPTDGPFVWFDEANRVKAVRGRTLSLNSVKFSYGETPRTLLKLLGDPDRKSIGKSRHATDKELWIYIGERLAVVKSTKDNALINFQLDSETDKLKQPF